MGLVTVTVRRLLLLFSVSVFNMDTSQSNYKITGYLLIISLLALVAPLALFVFRSLDDNRLTRWQWVFANTDIDKFFLVIIPGIILAYLLSRISFFDHNPTFLFLSSFLIAAVFWSEPEVIVDTSRYFTQAKHLKMYGIGYFIEEWGKNINAWTDLPLLPFLYGMIFKFFGETRMYIQIFTTLMFSLTVLLTYMIGKTLWDEDTGFYAGLLLLGIPYIFTQAPLMLVDIPTMFFLTLSIFTFIRAMDKGGCMMIMLSSVAISLTFFAKYSTWLMLSVLVIIFVVYLIQNTESRSVGTQSPVLSGTGQSYFYRGFIIALISGLLIGAVILYKLDLFSEQFNLIMTFQRPGLRRWSESFISTFFFQIHPFITIAALFSIYTAFKKKDFRYAIIIWLVLIIVVLQIKRIRYTIMIFPMLALMASYGLQEIKSKSIKKFIVSCIVISSIVLAVFAYLPFMQKMSIVNLKNAGEYLNTIDDPKVEVFVLLPKNPILNPSVAVPILDLFTKKDILFKYNKADFYQPWEKIEKSSLRFTWEYKNPEYYTSNNYLDGAATVVVIAGEQGSALPEHIVQRLKGYRMVKIFDTYERVFRYKTFVTIYQR